MTVRGRGLFVKASEGRGLIVTDSEGRGLCCADWLNQTAENARVIVKTEGKQQMQWKKQQPIKTLTDEEERFCG